MKRSVVASALLLCLLPIAPGAEADPTCGSTLTTDTTLTGDLSCAGTALRIGADGITVNLGGYTLSGNGAIGSAGIENTGWRDVTIENGTITGFFFGIHFEGASHNTIRSITADGNRLSGIYLEVGSDDNRIDACVVANNGTLPSFPGNGITINTSDGNVVTRTLAAGNRTQGIFVGGGAGTAASSNTRILNNTSHSNTSNGIGILGGSGHVVAGNISMNNGGHGISFSSTPAAGRVTGSSVTGNTVSGNARFGIEIRKADGNRIVANRVEASGLSGIAVIDTSNRNLVAGNRATTSVSHGLFVAGGTNSTFRGNEFDFNGRRGILVTPDVMFGTPQNNTFEGNHATDNVLSDVRDLTIGSGTAGTDSTYRGTRCDTSSPAGLCVP
jgi:parallel beta-helix repeat protein